MLIIAGFWSGKTNALLNLIKEQDDIDQIYLYAKNLSEREHELFKWFKCIYWVFKSEDDIYEIINKMSIIYQEKQKKVLIISVEIMKTIGERKIRKI